MKKEDAKNPRREGDIIITTPYHQMQDPSVFNNTDGQNNDEIDNIEIPYTGQDYSDMESNHIEGRLKDNELVKEIDALDMMQMNDKETSPGKDEFVIDGDDQDMDNQVLTPSGDDDNKPNMNQVEDDIDEFIIDGDDNENMNNQVLTPRGGDDNNRQNMNQFGNDDIDIDDEIDNIISPQFDEDDNNINNDDDIMTAGFIQ